MQFIIEYWAQWAFALMGGAILAAIPKIKAPRQAVLALLHDRIYTECYHFLSLGHITPTACATSPTSTRPITRWAATAPARSCTTAPRPCPSTTDRPASPGERTHHERTYHHQPHHFHCHPRPHRCAGSGPHQPDPRSALGKPLLPIDSTQLEQLISTGFTTVSALVNWWFNNSFTKEAIQADAEFERLKKSVK